MRKLVALELVSLDGVMEAPEEWAFPYSNDEMEEANVAGMAASDALLLGRVTYEGLAAFWPNQPGGMPMVDYINGVRKYVVSGTLEEPLGWNNSTLIKGDVAEGIAELKRQEGKNITIIGSGTLVRSLLREGLLDELRLMVHPVVLGRGRRLFEDRGDPKGLTLADSKTFDTGVVSLNYRPAAEANAVPVVNDTTSSGPSTGLGAAAGPLAVSETNTRYFTVAASDATDQRAVYLTGSHVNNNFHDGSGPGPDCSETPERNDYRGYLEFLKERGHNFIRLWRWEHFRSQVAEGNFHLCMRPQPWARTGPGTARDGKPRFDLSKFDPAYFELLRDYIIAAGNEGIYVSVMLFEGFGLHLSLAPDNVEGHPFHAANNVNEIGITSINDYQVLPLDPRVQALQEEYIRKVIDTVQDLPNVLYEVANESSGGGSVVDPGFLEAIGLSEPPDWGDSTQWQYWVINLVKQYEVQMGYARHPVGMTMQYPVRDQSKVNDVLFNSPADWISPGFDDVESPIQDSHWFTNPPANDGAKVIISDTDHYSPMKCDALWAWKSFVRGHNPILYDLGIVTGVKPPDPSSGSPSFASLEPARYAMGDTRRFAERLNLIAMEPRGELSSTGYVLADPGEEYLVLQPSETAGPFTVTLEPYTYSVQWYSVGRRETKGAGKMTVEDHKSTSFTAPFAEAGPAVLYLRRVGR